jgi:hypothetical protein
MQRAKLSPTVWLGLAPAVPARLELLRDPEPHPAIIPTATTTAATETSDRAGRVMAHVVPVHRLQRHNGRHW